MALIKRNENADFVSIALTFFTCYVSLKNKCGLNDDNHFAEYLYKDIINYLYGTEFINANTYDRNCPGIDLTFKDKKVFAQVSSTITKKKVQDSLNKLKRLKEYVGYHFMFIAIADETRNIKNPKTPYSIPNGVTFSPKDDIIDHCDIVNKIMELSNPNQIKICSQIMSEFDFGRFLEDEKRHDYDILVNMLSYFSCKCMEELFSTEPTSISCGAIDSMDNWYLYYYDTNNPVVFYDKVLDKKMRNLLNAFQKIQSKGSTYCVPPEPKFKGYYYVEGANDKEIKHRVSEIKSTLIVAKPIYDDFFDYIFREYQLCDFAKLNDAFDRENQALMMHYQFG